MVNKITDTPLRFKIESYSLRNHSPHAQQGGMWEAAPIPAGNTWNPSHKSFMSPSSKSHENINCICIIKQCSDQVTILLRPWQLCCHRLCKIMTWLNNLNYNYNNNHIHKIWIMSWKSICETCAEADLFALGGNILIRPRLTLSPHTLMHGSRSWRTADCQIVGNHREPHPKWTKFVA